MTSLLDLQSGMRLSQVLIHLGTTFGQEVVGTGVDGVSSGTEGAEAVVDTTMVEAEVRVCVETVV